jgi:membrane protease YdiL (CAAX protease family)
MLPSVLVYGAFTLAAAFIAAFAGLPSLFSLPLEGRGAIAIGASVAIAAIIVLGGRFLEQYEWYKRMGEVLREPVRVLLGEKSGASEALIVAISSAVGEESLFRGALQPGLARLFEHHLFHLDQRPAILLAIVATAVSFTLLHPPWKRELRPWTFFALAMGLAWGVIAAWSGSLAGPVLSHLLVNFFNLRRLLAWEPQGM